MYDTLSIKSTQVANGSDLRANTMRAARCSLTTVWISSLVASFKLSLPGGSALIEFGRYYIWRRKRVI